jgi:hypothetical protein
MPYSVTFSEDTRIVRIKNSGQLSMNEIVAQTGEAARLSKDKGSKLLLTDFSAVAVNTSLVDIFQFPELYESLGMDRTFKIAVLISNIELNTNELRFYENITLNRGWQVRIFLKEDEAELWLTGKAG